MRRIFNFILAVFIVMAFFVKSVGLASADSQITLSNENLAKAFGEAILWDSDGNTITADVDGKTVSFKIANNDENASNDENVSVDVKNVALIEFVEGENSKNITNTDFEDFIKNDISNFTGLKSFSLNNCLNLTTIDLSGNSTIEILDISNLTRLRTLKANNMPALKAVALARLDLESTSSLASLLGGSGGNNNSESTPAIATLSSNILEELTDLDLSNNANLSGVGYVLTQEKSSMGDLGSLFGGSSGSSSDNTPQFTKYGYRIHSVLTTLKKDTTFLKADKSYSEEPAANDSGFSLGGFLTGTTGNVLGNYSDETVNLLPALKTFNLNGSGIRSTYINNIDIEGLTDLTSADFSNMSKLSSILLPAGEQLKTLDLTNDRALKEIDLSYTKGFIYPIGFETLTGLMNLRIYARDEVDSIDVSPFTKLVTLNLTGDNLTSLDISKNPELVTLYIGNNAVNELNIDSQTKIRSLDISNNSLIKIDLSRNINMRVYKNNDDSTVRLSTQKRLMTNDVKKTFDFKEVYPQMTPVERANIVWDSVSGNGQKATSVDVDSGTVSFTYFPAVITYDYKTGINYENSSEPLCMTIELMWDITDEELQLLREEDSEDIVSEDITSEDITSEDQNSSINTRIRSGSGGGGCNFGGNIFGVAWFFSLGVLCRKIKNRSR